MSLIGRHDNACIEPPTGRRRSAKKHGALGYLNTDWGDGGHPQPLAVSYLPYLLGAAASWCAASYDEKLLVPVVNRDVFQDSTNSVGKAAYALGFAHLKLNYFAPNVTPLGATIAAPPPEQARTFLSRRPEILRPHPRQEDRSRTGRNRSSARSSSPWRFAAKNSRRCRRQTITRGIGFRGAHGRAILQIHALAASYRRHARCQKHGEAQYRRTSATGRTVQSILAAAPTKVTTATSTPFLRWRIRDYRRGVLHFPPRSLPSSNARPALINALIIFGAS